jgi:acetyl esterase/lipase
MNAWSQRLNKEGYITLAIDYLLFQPGETREPIYPRPERQVKASIQYLRRNANSLGINPNHIVLLGTSAGARLAGLVFVTPDNSFFSGPEKWPQVSDRANGFIGFYGSYTGALYRNAEQYYGASRDSSDPSTRQRLASARAVDQAANAPGPALLFHGESDRVSPPQQSRRLYEALKSAGKDATLIIMPRANHSFDRTRERVRKLTPQGEEAARSVISWLKQHFD